MVEESYRDEWFAGVPHWLGRSTPVLSTEREGELHRAGDVNDTHGKTLKRGVGK